MSELPLRLEEVPVYDGHNQTSPFPRNFKAILHYMSRVTLPDGTVKDVPLSRSLGIMCQNVDGSYVGDPFGVAIVQLLTRCQGLDELAALRADAESWRARPRVGRPRKDLIETREQGDGA